MQPALDLFRENMGRARDLIAISHVIQVQTTQALDLSDVLRAALVMSVSALDHFIHEAVRAGMLESYRAERPRTPGFLSFQVTIGAVLQGLSDPDSPNWVENQIRDRHGYRSFQTPDQIADAIRLISEAPLWSEVALLLGMDRREVTETLTLIVQRRNKIAHEADVMPDYAGQIVYSDSRSPIDEDLVKGAVNFIERISETIYTIVSTIPPLPSRNY